MKKIVCFLMAVISLLVFVLPVTAASITKESGVMEDLSTMTINGKAFSPSDYPADSKNEGLEILSFVECGFNTRMNSPDFALYVYVYNPACFVFDANERSQIQIGASEGSKSFDNYGLVLVSRSEDWRFLKFRVGNYGPNLLESLYQNQAKMQRVYQVACIRLYINEDSKTFEILTGYRFKGSDSKDNYTLTCEKFKFKAIQTYLHPTSWISPNAGSKVDGSAASIYDHYEINSVYFSIPKHYLEMYDYLSAINATYSAFHLTPIVVTRPELFLDETITYIEEGKSSFGAKDQGVDLNDLAVLFAGSVLGVNYQIPKWVYSNDTPGLNENLREYLAYYFEDPSLPENFEFEEGQNSKIVVSSKKLEDYFIERYKNPSYDNSLLYDRSEINQRLFEASEKLLNLSTYESTLTDFQAFFRKLTTKDDAYLWDDFNVNVNVFDVFGYSGSENEKSLADYTKRTDYEELANELLIGVNDAADFVGFCKEAEANGDVVVLLRFGYSDYNCMPLYEIAETSLLGSLWIEKQVGFAVDKWAYMDVSVCDLTFVNEAEAVVVPVLSNTVNSFGNIMVFEDPNRKGLFPDLEDNSRFVLFIIAIVVLILLVIWVISKLRRDKVKININQGLSERRKKKKRRKWRRKE